MIPVVFRDTFNFYYDNYTSVDNIDELDNKIVEHLIDLIKDEFRFKSSDYYIDYVCHYGMDEICRLLNHNQNCCEIPFDISYFYENQWHSYELSNERYEKAFRLQRDMLCPDGTYKTS